MAHGLTALPCCTLASASSAKKKTICPVAAPGEASRPRTMTFMGLHWRIANRLLAPEQRSVQARTERNDDVLDICHDNEAYMNTGVRRSSATPYAARTATTMAVGHGKKAARHIDAWLRGTAMRAVAKHAPTGFARLNTWYCSDATKSVRPQLDMARRTSMAECPCGAIEMTPKQV